MRTIPFRVVALLGMDDDGYPRRQPALGFDLTVRDRRPGDRTARDDDRYLFLEALISARQRLLVTYVGQDEQDGASLPPSVVVADLLDVIEQRCSDARDALLVRHPIQSFSARYFDGEDARLFGYDTVLCDAARVAAGARIEQRRFLSEPLAPDEQCAEVELISLERFWRGPIRALLQRRLGLYLGSDVDRLPDREPLDPDGLEAWELSDVLLRRLLSGADERAAKASVRARGLAPPGSLGEQMLAELGERAEQIAEVAHGISKASEPSEGQAFELALGPFRLSGRLSRLRSCGLVEVAASRIGGRSELSCWLRHLVLNCCRPAGVEPVTILVGRAADGEGPGVVRWGPVDDADQRLVDLLELHQRGQQQPLPFFPKSSRAYAEARSNGRSHEKALSAAAHRYRGRVGMPGEGEDIYVRQVLGARDPFDDDCGLLDAGLDFSTLACRVFDPLLAGREQR